MNLKAAIVLSGISQTNMAKMLGIQDTKLSRIVNGHEVADDKTRAKIVSILKRRKVDVQESEIF